MYLEKTAKISVKNSNRVSRKRSKSNVIKTLKPQKSTKFLALTKDAISLSMVNVIYRTVCQLFRPYIPLYDGDGIYVSSYYDKPTMLVRV